MKGCYYVCPECRKSYMEKHEVKKTEKKPSICPACGREMLVVQFFLWK